MSYIGRFAPSPTGPLHFGSLVAALASFLDARKADGLWLLRIEDLDPPRESTSAAAEIMTQLESLGLIWDKLLYQSTRLSEYQETLEFLTKADLVYPCTCNRKTVPAIYPGNCRNKKFKDTKLPHSIRLRVRQSNFDLEDLVFGEKNWDFSDEIGDFIIKRKDGLFAYQLAVVVDDHFQGVTRVVRGIDLLESTPRQLALYGALNLKPPEYLHIPILADKSGNKLSKQSHARPIEIKDPISILNQALIVLGQNSQSSARNKNELLSRAIKSWQIDRIPKLYSISTPPYYL